MKERCKKEQREQENAGVKERSVTRMRVQR